MRKLSDLAEDIARFIAKRINSFNSFGSRSFYGESFSLALLQMVSMLDERTKSVLLHEYANLDKNAQNFHWEFNNYALFYYARDSKDPDAKGFIDPLIFKNTPCTNWTLLRSNIRLKAGVDIALAISEAKDKIYGFQLNSGLILDDPGVKSFQYHCFSMAMIGEIYETTSDVFFKNSFLNGVSFIRNFILSNGESLYIGRGQNQSFGYGALIYILALGYKFTGDRTMLGDLDRVVDFLMKYQRKDGSFPLVFNGIEKTIPKVVDMADPEFSGWYAYNNYFDYLSFMGFFIAKANSALKGFDTSNIAYRYPKAYRDDCFIKVVRSNYEAVISKGGGYFTNDMPIPYIVTKGKGVTPCYGGEQFQESLYSVQDLPLPYFYKLNKSIRWRSLSFFRKDALWIVSPLGVMKRRYLFDDSCVRIKTRIYSVFSFKHVYLFLKKGVRFCGQGLESDGYGFSASGELLKYASYGNASEITIDVES